MEGASNAANRFYWLLGYPTGVIAEIDSIVADIASDDNGVAVCRFGKEEPGILLTSLTMLAVEANIKIYGDRRQACGTTAIRPRSCCRASGGRRREALPCGRARPVTLRCPARHAAGLADRGVALPRDRLPVGCGRLPRDRRGRPRLRRDGSWCLKNSLGRREVRLAPVA